MRLRRQKKGQVYMGFLVILTLAIFGMLFVTMQQKKEPFTREIGERQAAVLATVQEAQKAQLYVDLAAVYAYENAVEDIAADWYATECGSFRGVPILYGEEDCMQYNEQLTAALEQKVGGTFSYYLEEYTHEYPDAPLLELSYDLSFTDGEIIARAQEPFSLPVMSKTSARVAEEVDAKTVSSVGVISIDTWPVDMEGENRLVTSCFGYRTIEGGSKYHAGADMRSWSTNIIAAADGTVIEIVPSWGRVVLDHGAGISTGYLHMDTIAVEMGDVVKKGEAVGTSGGRGVRKDRTTGEIIKQGNDVYAEHLHFELFSEDFAGMTITDEYGNNGVLSSFGRGGAINPLCFFDAEEIGYIVAQNSNNACLEYGGAYKFCDQYEKYAPNAVEEIELLLGASTLESCSAGSWSVDASSNSQTAYEEWAKKMAEHGVQGYGVVSKLTGNGPSDSYLRSDTGRDTVVFVPCTTNTDKPVELIYYFHGMSGFTQRSFNVVMPQILEMMQEGRNFVIVYPELTWSMGDPTSTSSTPYCKRCVTSADFPGGRQKGLLWVTSLGDGNFGTFHDQILETLSALHVKSIGTITMLGHSAGGAALHNAAPFMQQIGVDQVKLSDSDYYFTSKAVYQHAPNVAQYILFQYDHDYDDLAAEGDGTPTRFAIDFLEDIFGVDQSVLVAGEIYTVPSHNHIHALPLEKTHAQISAMSLAWTPEDNE